MPLEEDCCVADFQQFIQAVVAGNLPVVRRMLKSDPSLATQVCKQGATRQNSREYFFESIGHYMYAGDTALHMAAAAHHAAMIRLLLKAGSEIEAKNRRGATALHYAADGGPGRKGRGPKAQADAISALCQSGANLQARTKDGVCALHRAVRTRCSLAVAALLAAGADRNARNKNGSTPLLLAQRTTGRGGSGTPEAKLEQTAILNLLA